MVPRQRSNKKRMPYKLRKQQEAAQSTQIFTFLPCKLALLNKWFRKSKLSVFQVFVHAVHLCHTP